MKAATYRRYGGPEVLGLEALESPEPGPGEVLIAVDAAAVTTADWRLRAAAFPGLTWLPGRLMFGLFRPRRRVLGGNFAGRVVALGAGASRFAPGDRVFGVSGFGAHAEQLVMPESGTIAKVPAGVSPVEAAAVPFGGLSALVFLRDMAELREGQRVLVVGASGGVGAYAVQIARALGAHVDGVCGPDHVEMVRRLGAAQVFDYTREDFTAADRRWDVILDTVGMARLTRCRAVLAPEGRFVPLNIHAADVWAALTQRLRGGPRVVIGVSPDRREDLDALVGMIEAGTLRPMVDRVYPFERIREAHAQVETRHRAGAIVLDMADGAAPGAA